MKIYPGCRRTCRWKVTAVSINDPTALIATTYSRFSKCQTPLQPNQNHSHLGHRLLQGPLSSHLFLALAVAPMNQGPVPVFEEREHGRMLCREDNAIFGQWSELWERFFGSRNPLGLMSVPHNDSNTCLYVVIILRSRSSHHARRHFSFARDPT